MPSGEIYHSIVLVLAIGASFIFSKTTLAQYDLQVTAVLFIILFVAKRLKRGGKMLESVIFTMIIFILINTTGGINSPFFFLLYFLLFSLTLLLEPTISIVTTLTAITFFLVTLPENPKLESLLPVFSLAFLTPFALFMGKQYEKNILYKLQNSKLKEDTNLFLSLMLKNHLKNIKNSVSNFMGDHELKEIEKSTRNMEKLIEKFEKENEA